MPSLDVILQGLPKKEIVKGVCKDAGTSHRSLLPVEFYAVQSLFFASAYLSAGGLRIFVKTVTGKMLFYKVGHCLGLIVSRG